MKQLLLGFLGEDPGWLAGVFGTSEQMIWRRYRKWIPSQKRDQGRRVAAVLGPRDGGGDEVGPDARARLVPAAGMGSEGQTRPRRCGTPPS